MATDIPNRDFDDIMSTSMNQIHSIPENIQYDDVSPTKKALRYFDELAQGLMKGRIENDR